VGERWCGRGRWAAGALASVPAGGLLPSRLAVRERSIPAPPIPEPPIRRTGTGGDDLAARPGRWGWITAAAVLAVAILFVVLTRMKPAYDAYGWLVWGRQTLHWNLNTDGAPSWKPLTFMFTFPYALVRPAQPWLWSVTSVAGSLGSAVFGGRIAYRLTGPSPGRRIAYGLTGPSSVRRYAPIAAAAFAGVGVLGISGYWHQMLIANSDPMVVAICLAAIDAHLSKRLRLAFVLLVLASMGRPEAWPFTAGYAIWSSWKVPSMRLPAAVGVLAIPAVWFGVSALTAKSWSRAGDLALNSVNVIHGDKFTGVIGRVFGLYGVPMQIAAGLAILFALLTRERVWLWLAGAAFAWIGIEIGLALHGWSAVTRYLFEPEAVFVVLAGAGVGRVLAVGPAAPAALRWAGVAAVVGLIAALVPTAVLRTRVAHSEVLERRQAAVQISRLEHVIRREGGAARIRACGQPVTTVGWQSTLAWETELNVGKVGYKPGRSIAKGDPIVLFKPHAHGWQVRPIHMLASRRAACRALRTDSAFG
jgi:hypothetical protein